MRRFLVLFSSVLLCLTLCACGKNSAINLPFLPGFSSGSAQGSKIEETYPNGTLRYVREPDEKTGEILETYYYENGQIQTQSRLTQTGITLSSAEYTETGVLTRQYQLDAETGNTLEKTYFISGELKSETHTTPTGQEIYYQAYYENGQTEAQRIYNDQAVLQEEYRYNDQGGELYFYRLDPETGYADQRIHHDTGIMESNTIDKFGEIILHKEFTEDGTCIAFSSYNAENGISVDIVAEDGQYLTVLDTSASDLNIVVEVRVFRADHVIQHTYGYSKMGILLEEIHYHENGVKKESTVYNGFGYATHYTTWAEQGERILDCKADGGNYFLFTKRSSDGEFVGLNEYFSIDGDFHKDDIHVRSYNIRENGYLSDIINYISIGNGQYTARGRTWYDETGKEIYDYQCAEGNTMYGSPETGYIQECNINGDLMKKVIFYENTCIPKEISCYDENGRQIYAARYSPAGKQLALHEIQQQGNYLNVAADWSRVIELTDTNAYARYTVYNPEGILLYDEFCDSGKESNWGTVATKIVVYDSSKQRHLTFKPKTPGNLITASCQYNLEPWDSNEIWVWECDAQGKGLSRTIYTAQGYRKEERIYNATGRQTATWTLFSGRTPESERFSYTVSAPDHYIDFIYLGKYADRLIERDANGNEVNSVSIRNFEIPI